MTDEQRWTVDERDELAKLREQSDNYRRLWLRAAEEHEAAENKLTEAYQRLETAWDLTHAAWHTVGLFRERYETARAALEEERHERDALVRLEVDRLVGREPKRRGRPPNWQPGIETDLELKHREGASIRQLADDLGMSKTQVHRIIARVRRQKAEAAERARVTAIMDGRSPAQRTARVAKQAADKRSIEEPDPVRPDRGLEYLESLPTEDDQED